MSGLTIEQERISKAVALKLFSDLFDRGLRVRLPSGDLFELDSHLSPGSFRDQVINELVKSFELTHAELQEPLKACPCGKPAKYDGSRSKLSGDFINCEEWDLGCGWGLHRRLDESESDFRARWNRRAGDETGTD